MSIVLAWLRLDLRRRWKSLLALALLVALAGSVVMTALAGANRGMSSLDRLLARTTPVDAMVLANTPESQMDWSWSEFDELPYVKARSGFILVFTSGIKELDDFNASDGADFPHADDTLFFDYDQPVVYEGRLYDPNKIEAVVTPDFANETGLGVGDSFTLKLGDADQANNGTETVSYANMRGPELKVPIVGEIRSTWMYDDGIRDGGFSLSPGIVEKYPESFYGNTGSAIVNSQFALENGRADIPRLRNDVKKITGRADVDVWDWHSQYDSHRDTLTFEGRALQAFGVAALLASLFLIGQAVTRFASAEADELRTARALGMTPRQVLGAATATTGLAGAVGGAIAVGASLVASRWFPIGTAGHIEPDPGIDVDWLVLGGGVLVIAGLIGSAALLGARRALSARDAGTPERATYASRTLASLSAPVPAVVGTRFALEAGRGASAVPVRPAIAGAIAGLLGVSSVMVFSSAIEDAVSHPERFGETFQLAAFGGFNGDDFVSPEVMTEAVTALEDVTGFVDAPIAVATVDGGAASVELFGHKPSAAKPLKTVVLDGRMPERADEVTLTPGSLEALTTKVGNTIDLEAEKGARTLTVVGSAFVPPGPHNDYNSGGWVTDKGFDALFETFKYHPYYVSTDPTAGSGKELQARINAALLEANPRIAPDGEDVLFVPESQGLGASATRTQLQKVQALPIALAGFLGLLAVGAVGHAMATAVRRRGHDIAVLRAIGLTPGGSRMIVGVHATVLVLVGIAFGVPLGLAFGRTVWRIVADYTPLDYVAPTAFAALSLVALSALLVAYVVAAWPAFRASRLRVATVLRAE